MTEPAKELSPELISGFSEVSNATALGALARRGYNKVYMNGVASLAKGRRMAGVAVTLRYLPSRPDLQAKIATGTHGEGFNETPRWRALESLAQGKVLVADAMGMSNVSTGGDVVFSRILTQQAAGLVTDGAVRDGAKVAQYGYPVFAGGSTPTIGEPNILPYEVNEPIQCGGILVWPGDLVLGDDDGVVVCPSGLAEEILPECIHHDEMEAAVLDHTMRERISPSRYYPFNEETERLHAEWLERQRSG